MSVFDALGATAAIIQFVEAKKWRYE